MNELSPETHAQLAQKKYATLSELVDNIAQTILDGFNKHYRIFRQTSAGAKQRFETADWAACADANVERIQMYDQRVKEATTALGNRFHQAEEDESLWPKIKIAYIGKLYGHHQPELAETFFNSVACRVLHRSYYDNEYIFWRPAISTEHIEGQDPIYRCYYPETYGMRQSLHKLLTGFEWNNEFVDIERDVVNVETALNKNLPMPWRPEPNYQIQVLGAAFFRNKAAYIVGRVVNGSDLYPFALPVLLNAKKQLVVDALLMEKDDVATLFSFSRAYFMVDMEVPSAYVDFLKSILPEKPELEIYATLGLQKQGKTMFYRQLQHHLKYSSDNFVIAPGIKGMVMLVFTLPSFPFVFKIIKDAFDPPKTSNREEVKSKYLLVKYHDRVGRLADTLEYSLVAIPLKRIEPDLLEELKNHAGSTIEFDGDELLLKHVYIERRMTPLNDYLATAEEHEQEKAVLGYGQAIRDLAGANIFPGDMLLKNFGVTRHGRIVFYDYDEICYMTECNFRHVPPSEYMMDEMMADPYFSVRENDVFPEEFSCFFFNNQSLSKVFYSDHKDLVDADYWISVKEQILAGDQQDIFPYTQDRRFISQAAENEQSPAG